MIYSIARNVLIGIWIGLFSCYAYEYVPPEYDNYKKSKVRQIYDIVSAQTGQIQDKLPLVISDEGIVNAYNDGSQIVIYMGIVNASQSWDEVALILGHEIAHGTLGHLEGLDGLMSNAIAVLEGNADKMGAVYMMKAGYDICKGREFWHRQQLERGNYQGQNHPNYSYRYDELDIGCEK
jgi:predicted Zn-dependent protease